MFNWITKPFIEWNMIDKTICYLEIGCVCILIVLLAMFIIYIKDKLKRKKHKKEIK